MLRAADFVRSPGRLLGRTTALQMLAKAHTVTILSEMATAMQGYMAEHGAQLGLDTQVGVRPSSKPELTAILPPVCCLSALALFTCLVIAHAPPH